MGRSHFRIERDGSGEFSLCFLPTLESGECITELEMCEGIIGAFRMKMASSWVNSRLAWWSLRATGVRRRSWPLPGAPCPHAPVAVGPANLRVSAQRIMPAAHGPGSVIH